MIPVIIPTKPYIKAYLELRMPDGKVDGSTQIGKHLLSLLEKDTDHQGSRPAYYPVNLQLNVNIDHKRRRGCWLNATQTREFNSLVARIIKDEIYTIVKTYLEFDKRLNKAFEYARTQLQLDEELFSDDAMAKDWQRQRKKKKGTFIYNVHDRNNGASVLSKTA